MAIIIHKMEQGSDEWFDVKAGKISASRAKDLMAKKTTATYQNLIHKIAAERVTGEYIKDGYFGYAMQRGKDLEPEARGTFEFLTGNDVETVGFIEADDWTGCSPDGLLDDSGLEIKCPLAHTQARYLFKGDLPAEYVLQVQFSLMITGFSSWHFFSYHPAMKPLHIEVKPIKKKHSEIEQRLVEFKKEVEKVIQKLKR
jgi:putative phage-type endonuclease